MYLAIVGLPLLGAILSGFTGRFIGKEGAKLISTFSVALSALLSCIAFYEVGLLGSPCYIRLMTWIDVELFEVSWGLLFDSLTVCMLVVVTCISSLVHIYSMEYMEGDPHQPRFMSYLSLFTFFMLVLVTGDNLIQMFLGWEGVGLCSYLLINFWFTRLEANKAAMKAIIVNRVGDFGLSLGIMGIFYYFQSVDFATIFATVGWLNQMPEAGLIVGQQVSTSTSLVALSQPPAPLADIDYDWAPINSIALASGISAGLVNFDPLTLICIFLFIGAVGKSAQIGLHTWLPDAMEGPTPVSALIHAATMVTAGVFLIIRCSPLFEYAPDALLVVTFLGALTAFFAATTGLLQNDLKRVIAYSTCSQLGYMVFACGISCYTVSLFHLANHAFFKALLFLSAGSVIHALGDEQDMRRMGGLLKFIPFTYVMFVIGSLSLMGFPFLTGFYSKDVILECAAARFSFDASFAHWLGTLSAFFTAFYSFRLLYLTFLAKTNASRSLLGVIHDSPILMALPLMILAFGSIFIGYLTKDMIIGLGTNFWNNAVFALPAHQETFINAEFLPTSIKLAPVLFSISGALFAFIFYHFYASSHFVRFPQIYGFLNQKWYFDQIYSYFIVKPIFSFAYNISFKLLDRGIIEIIGPTGLYRTIKNLAQKVTSVQTGFIYHYTYVMIIGLTFFITLLGIWAFFQFNAVYSIDSRIYFIFLLTLLGSTF